MSRKAKVLAFVAVGFITLTGINSTANAGLIHRYSFTDGAKDSAGKLDGKLVGEGARVADGKLVLKNENAGSGDAKVSYLDLGGSILPKGGDSVSFVFWFNAKDVGPFARILNVGDKEGTEGRAFIYFTPATEGGQARAAISAGDTSNRTPLDNERLDDGMTHMVAVVIDGKAKKMHVFIDGKEPTKAEDLGENTLDKVRPVNNWIGRSSFDNDAGLSGTVDEFRVYDQALSAEEVGPIFKAGADSLP